ncbi:2-succinyl-6-hydroxy-2,4-cyclohexadiene-1-carboxylate synthase [Actinobacillus arthritidis]|uniref:2-succinyl-6-hydroxy-2, 4-cyclohexadiene-1-carboxylate synthase n=1 Tax=Actinobacillus arthritidis TaxID=157339 RepID=UPI002443687E|nr:2-succinyl-6-hydroxy-2,4-cyclohexadiene-1-carboxylate synthase [Actinobacillus arthritidis]WGE89081.1 2-succinyl-6-hydroxy-2,4-cyclohexadiene-1-carboxylate synthase [Actinobacillus arthritidis]
MLHATWHSETGTPVVFLHGLLGSQQDWQAVLDRLQNFPEIRPLTIDLPLHGASEHIACHGFTHARELIHQTILHYIGNQAFYLIGYSLGGRLALDYTLNAHNPHLKHTILEGANIGLATDTERQTRWQNDQQWAERFRQEPMTTVLNDWYQQAVFANLDLHQRSNLIQKRQNNHGIAIATMLEATSLAKQTYYQPLLIEKNWNITFLIGEKDRKFRKMVCDNNLNHHIISDAGHNVHTENPQAFLNCLLGLIEK